MSTFRGIIREFPDIRIDFFRTIPDVRPPLACFLSHVHSDHLAGLESLKSPFIYCSAATKELLLRLERYPHRMNFAKGILESRKQHYKHLKNLLKPIPLETPTCIELTPGKKIQVTLFDANHCTGAVMFLIEDADNAILYTGDIRSEPWFVNRLARSPFLVEYSSGLKILDCIYLDTSNAGNDLEFPTKAEGLKELMQKIAEYPKDTTFHFAAWTFGYEEVWMMLSRLLNSPIHVDSYKMRLYQSLRGNSAGNSGRDSAGPALSHEASVLAGYKCGNTEQPGILTHDQTVRLHSCEKGTGCSAVDQQNIVWIWPMICRKGAVEVAEVGLGGGGGDLTQNPELELDDNSIYQLLQLLGKVDHAAVDEVQQKLLKALHSTLKSLSLADMGMDREEDEISLDDLTKVLIRSLTRKGQESNTHAGSDENVSSKNLPKMIKFPYSRHSSHSELCDLLKAFRPADIYPCTVDEDSWHEGVSIEALFGTYCSKTHFRHDSEMRALHSSRMEEEDDEEEDVVETQFSRASSEEASMPPPSSDPNEDDATKLASFDGNASPKAIRSDARDQRSSLQSAQGMDIPDVETIVSLAIESQNRRRKAIEDLAFESRSRRRKAVEEFVRGPVKRIRTSASPDREEVVYSDMDADGEDHRFSTFYDALEDVYRCSKCGWEVWMPEGSCGPCGIGVDAYEELILPRMEAPDGNTEPHSNEGTPTNPMHNLMQVGTDLELDPEIQARLEERYLDFASSAYSDEDDERSSDYETNSMIDDASIDSGDSDRDEVIDWEAKYKALSREHDQLRQRLEQAEYIILGDGSDPSDIFDAEGDEAGDVRMVEVNTRDPDLAEVVVPSTSLLELGSDQMDSQMSSMLDEIDEIDDVEELRREAADFMKNNVESLGSQWGHGPSPEITHDEPALEA